MSNYVLVHGAWHGGWAWDRVADRLRSEGHQVLTPDLPGHGSDRRPLAEMTMAAYVDHIAAMVEKQHEPVVLAGHSMSGAVISQVADRCADSVRQLVYVCAFLLRPGESVLGTMEGDEDGRLGARLAFNEDQSGARMDTDTLHEVFYNQASEAEIAWASPQLLDLQPVAPLATPVQLPHARIGSLPRAYVKCMRDRVLSPAAQQRLIEAQPCGDVIELDADHAPFLSRASELTNFLGSL